MSVMIFDKFSPLLMIKSQIFWAFVCQLHDSMSGKQGGETWSKTLIPIQPFIGSSSHVMYIKKQQETKAKINRWWGKLLPLKNENEWNISVCSWEFASGHWNEFWGLPKWVGFVNERYFQNCAFISKFRLTSFKWVLSSRLHLFDKVILKKMKLFVTNRANKMYF